MSRSVLRKTVDVLCSSLMSEAPLPTLGLLNAFITDLSASPSYGQVLRSLDASQHVNQVFFHSTQMEDLIFMFRY